MEEKSIHEMIDTVLDVLYSKDKYLIEIEMPETDLVEHVGERAIVFRFGIYLQKELNQSIFKEYNLDCEYNRNGTDGKKLPSFINGVYPDMIIHKRGSNDKNQTIIEFKGWWNQNQDTDISKIIEFVDQNGEYKYKEGYTILLAQNRNDVEVKRYAWNEKNGRVERI